MTSFLDIFFPPRCMGCGTVGSYICTHCRKNIIELQPLCPVCDRQAIDGMTHPRCTVPLGLDGLISVFRNQGVIKKVIKSIKYRFIYDSAKTLIDILPGSILANLTSHLENAVLYPIPLHRDRLKWRGFNQAEKLGEIVAKRMNIKTIDGVLIRKEKRTPQADISHREDRIKNAQGLFTKTSKLESFRSRSILLFDDVWTTGVTMKEACKVLKRGGVQKVWGMTIAR